MHRTAAICLLTLGLSAAPRSATAAGTDEPPAPWRRIPIPEREHGYRNFETRSFATRQAWETFRDRILDQEGWNRRDPFVAAIDGAAIDFDRETLVLVRHTEGSGSTRVTLHRPRLADGVLTCTITTRAPEIGTADMAYRCFALAVAKAEVERLTVERAPVASAASVELSPADDADKG